MTSSEANLWFVALTITCSELFATKRTQWWTYTTKEGQRELDTVAVQAVAVEEEDE